MSNKTSTGIWFQFLLIAATTNISALIVLALWRLITPTTLLFDQFVLLTFMIFMASLYLLQMRIFSKIKSCDNFTKFLVATVCALFFFSTFEYGILAVDRSRSLYVFQWVKDGKIDVKGGIHIRNVKSIEAKDQNAIYQRIIEQEKRKLMYIDQDSFSVKLTTLGDLFLSSARLLSKVFSLNGWRSNST
jgi:hypothetical protein